MTVLNEKDEQILKDYLGSYKECFEAMNDLLCKITTRVKLTENEQELAEKSNAKYKNMLYHMRKWDPAFRKVKIK